MKRFIVLLSFSVMIFFICGAPTISFRVLRPSLIHVPEYINSVALIDRSALPKKSNPSLESVLTGELPSGDKIASFHVLEGLNDAMQNSGRYNVIRTSESMVKNTDPEIFPDPIPWSKVSELCSEFKSDAILSLEIFDSDYIIPTNMIRVIVGFRFYDPKEKRILDENIITQEMIMDSPQKSIAGIVNRLFEKDDAVRTVSFDAGVVYGERVSPSWDFIEREYFRKPKKDRYLSEGARMMEVNDWDAAIEALEKAVDSKKRKTRGRAAHNLAVVYEILGDYEQAQNWAKDAWGKYENKASKDYSYILGQRMRENQ
jgi:tetratricopeptide (TPR) repeat protein